MLGEKPNAHLLRRLWPGMLVGIIVGIVAGFTAFLRPGWMEGLELYTYDVRARSSADKGRADPRIVMVDVDDYDIRWVHRNSHLSWPWPRELFAVAAKHLLERGAAAVVFDFVFVDPGNAGVEDVERFGEVLGSSTRTVIGLELSRFGRSIEEPGPWAALVREFEDCKEADELARQLLWWQSRVFLSEFRGENVTKGCKLWIGGEESEESLRKELERLAIQEPFEELLKDLSQIRVGKLKPDEQVRELREEDIAVEMGRLPDDAPDDSVYRTYPHIIPPLMPLMVNSAMGVVRQDPEKDGLFRRYAPVMAHRSSLFPSFGVAVAMAAFPEKKPELKGNDLFFDGRRIPLDENGRVVLRYHGSGDIYSRVGIRHVLNVAAQEMEINLFRETVEDALSKIEQNLIPKEEKHSETGDSKGGDTDARRLEILHGAVESIGHLKLPEGCGEKLTPLLQSVRKTGSAVNKPREEQIETVSRDADPAPSAASLISELKKVFESGVCVPKIDDTLVKQLEKSDGKNPGSMKRIAGMQPGTVEGRIFIIHAAAAAMRDLKPTPLDARALGAEINATFIDNLLNDDFVRRIPRLSGALLSFLLCFLLGTGAFFLVGMVRSALMAALSSLLITAGLIGALALTEHLLFKRHGVWVDFATPFLGALVTWAGVVAMHVYKESLDRRFVQDALGRYTSPALVRELMNNPKALSLEWGESRDLTVFFSDVVSFTSISERLGPQKLVVLLNEYLTAMTDIILEENGIVDKYIGDAIMAFWGAPLDDDKHALHACRAALRTKKKLMELQGGWKERFSETVNFRAGINTGNAVAGNMGSLHKYNYTVMGDTVNLAARLEGANKVYGTTLMIAKGTRDLVADEILTRELDWMTVKGKEEPVKIYELLVQLKEADPGIKKMVERFEAALQIYRNREFSEAKIAFRSILNDYPGDRPSELYVERCEEYERTPPPDDWDGVFRMTTK